FDVYDDRFGDTRVPDEFVMPERPASAVVPLARQWIAERAGRAGRTSGARAFQASGARAFQASGARAFQASGGRSDPPGPPDHPWFVWLHLFDPHAPYRPPPPFDA